MDLSPPLQSGEVGGSGNAIIRFFNAYAGEAFGLDTLDLQKGAFVAHLRRAGEVRMPPAVLPTAQLPAKLFWPLRGNSRDYRNLIAKGVGLFMPIEETDRHWWDDSVARIVRQSCY
jgi:hypothetical protein